MKKYGKYEKMPDGTRARQTVPKSMLLKTYLTSLLCMVLCVAMFFGTSYAWFTSEVTNTGNEIYIGTLDVGLFKQVGDQQLNLADSNNKLFDSNIRWEPGYTSLETVKIVNKGDLAFLYELRFADGKINGNTDATALRAVAEHFVIYVHAGEFTQNDPKPESFADIKENAEKDDNVRTWEPVRIGNEIATLADILEKKIPILSDSMSDVRTGVANPAAPVPGPNDSKETEATYIIALHMKEDAQGNDLMGHKIGLNVKLTAYQLAYKTEGHNEIGNE